MAAPTFQAAGTAASGIGDITPTWPAHQANDIGLLITEVRSQDVVTAPTGWVAVADSPQASSGLASESTELAIFWRRAEGSSETNPTITDPGNHVIGQILTFRGCVTTGDPWDVTAGDTNLLADTAVSIPGDTTTVADCLIVAACAATTDITTAQFSGWTNADLTDVTERTDVFTDAGNGGGFGVATGVKATAGAFGATTATLATSSEQARIMVALKPAAAGGPTVVDVTDTVVVTAQEGTSGVQAGLSATETVGLSVTEAQESLVSSDRPDTIGVAITEAQESLIASDRPDTVALALTESQDSLLLSERTDTIAVAADEATVVSVLIEVTDAVAVATAETSDLFISEAKAVSDTVAVGLTEAQDSLLSSGLADTVALVTEETTANFLTSERADSLDLVAVDVAATTLLLSPVTDALTLAVAEISEVTDVTPELSKFFLPPSVRISPRRKHWPALDISSPRQRPMIDFRRGQTVEIAGVEYHGGRWYGPLSAQQVTDITAAGYGARIVALVSIHDRPAGLG